MIEFKTKVAKVKDLKPSQTSKLEPCWIYEQGQYRWEGKIAAFRTTGENQARPDPP